MSAPNIAGAPLPQRARGYWKARSSAWNERLESLLEAERAQLPLWFVVGLGAGIAGWFALGGPSQWIAFICICAGFSVAGFTAPGGRAGRSLGLFCLAMAIGCGLVWSRAESATQMDWKTLTGACSGSDIVVSDRWLPRSCHARWLKLDKAALGRTGGMAIYLGTTPRVETVAERIQQHPWRY